jgi:hypothetical protein
MSFSKKEFDIILQEETIKLLAEEGVQEGFLDRIKDLYKSFTKPRPNASQGVGRAFAGYKYKPPAKQATTTQQQDPETQPAASTSLTKKQPDAMEPSDALPGSQDNISATGRYDLGTEPKLPPSQQKALPPSQKSPETVQPSGDLPPSGNMPIQLPAPKKIGVIPQYQPLMLDIDKIDFQKLRDKTISELTKAEIYLNKNRSQKAKIIKDAETVLKYLVSTKRVIQNTTIGPTQENAARPTPSLQQIGSVKFDSWYVASLIATTEKYYAGYIDSDVIKFVIGSLFNDGRLAISQRLYNKLIHTNDPRITDTLNTEDHGKNTQESKDYKNFYNSWKQYTKTGVIL